MKGNTVGRLSRAIDLGSLLLFILGAALYLWAYFGMQDLRNRPHAPFAKGTMEAYALLNEYLWLQQLSYFGLVLVGAGVAVGLSAAAHHHKIGKRRAAESLIQE